MLFSNIKYSNGLIYNLADFILSNFDGYFLFKQYHFIQYFEIIEKVLVYNTRTKIVDFIVFSLSK